MTFRGVPNFFRGCVAEARAGEISWSAAGWHLANSTPSLIEAEDGDDRERKLTELRALCKARDRPAVAAWYQREFPACMKLVLWTKHEAFARGVIEAYNGGRLDPGGFGRDG